MILMSRLVADSRHSAEDLCSFKHHLDDVLVVHHSRCEDWILV